MKLKSIDLSQSSRWLSVEEKVALIDIIGNCFEGISPENYFIKYFSSDDAFERKLRLYFDQGKLVGYCLLVFSQKDKTVLIRASAAFYSEYRQSGHTFGFSIKQAIQFWLKNFKMDIYYADTMLSPAMYRAIAKKTGIVWPSKDTQVNCKLFEQLNPNGLVNEINNLRCLQKVDRKTNYSENEIINFNQSKKEEIAYYCKINPDFDKGVALFVVLPINLKQYFYTFVKWLSKKESI